MCQPMRTAVSRESRSVKSRRYHLRVDLPYVGTHFAMVHLAFEGLPAGVRSGWPFMLHPSIKSHSS